MLKKAYVEITNRCNLNSGQQTIPLYMTRSNYSTTDYPDTYIISDTHLQQPVSDIR